MVSTYPNSQIYDLHQMYDFKNQIQKKTLYTSNSLMEIINEHPDLSIFCKLIKKAKYENKLSYQEADFTLFVTSDQQLKQKYPPDFFETIDKGKAIQILNASIMNRKIDKKLIQENRYVKYQTLSKSTVLEISTLCNETIINGYIKIIHFNQPASNGIIHIISDFIKPY